MTRRFILIDHSIEDSSGHHLEYARRVLRAAKEEGFQTLLVTNIRAHGLDCTEADVLLKMFSKSVWENHAQSKFSLVTSFSRKKKSLAGDPRFARQFAKELLLLVTQAKLTQDDIVFIPTLGGAELVGISLYSSLKAAKPLNWHLLFRRDVPIPNSLLDFRRHITQARIHSAFLEANTRFKKGTRYFYTDTDGLTAQYKRLSVGDFTTLPIPIDDQLRVKKVWQKGPLVVSYLGDLREEKGVHLLPDLIVDIRKYGFGKDKVIFRIQGNLPNVGSTHIARRIKSALSNKMLEGVEVLEGPFDSKAYNRLIESSDIVLVPYCPISYAVRSSGIFAEALAAGVSTIYTRASWMEKNVPGSLAFGYKKQGEFAECLKEMLTNYQFYQSASLSYSKQWREYHSAQRLIHLLVKTSLSNK